MQLDHDRIAMNRQHMREHNIDAVVCARPTSVLLFSGFWPVAGQTLALATLDSIAILTPADELPLARDSWADDVRTYELGSLKKIQTLCDAIQPALQNLLQRMNLGAARIGFEAGPWVQPSPYAALGSFGEMLSGVLQSCVPHADLVPVDDMLAPLRLIKTGMEISKIRTSCGVAASGFRRAAELIRRGETEMHIAAQFRNVLMGGTGADDRCDGYAFCMSGPNAAEAYKFFQHTRHRALSEGDMALVHCNSHVNGYWTDVTRTFHLGEPSEKHQAMYDAVFTARQAALAAIRSGTRCCEVDRAARSVMEARGFGDQFKHPLGHGVGFSGIDQHAMPRLHPVSPDVLEEGAVFNVEPAIYIEGQCGMRHCDVVACTRSGAEVLTEFYNRSGELII